MISIQNYEISRCETSDGTLVDIVLGAHKFPEAEAMERGRRLENEVKKRLHIQFKKTGLFILDGVQIFGA